MAVDRTLWDAYFTYGETPAWPCPSCSGGTLHLHRYANAEFGTERYQLEWGLDESTRRTINEVDHNEFEETGVVAAVLECHRCRDSVSVAGRMRTAVGHDQDGEPTPYHQFFPLFFFPELPVIKVPNNCPDNIRQEIRSACRVFWSDPSSCLNRLRASCELFVADLLIGSGGIPSEQNSLGRRLTTVRDRFPQLHEVVDAARILGNEGSHPGSVTRRDALDGFDVIDHLLDAVFNPDNLRRIVEEIRIGNGPRPRPT